MTIDELIENFELFDEWEDRYRYVIDLGRALPPLEPQYQTDAFKVEGCMSRRSGWCRCRPKVGRSASPPTATAPSSKGLAACC